MSYGAKRSRVMAEGARRGKAWTKRALRQLDEEYGAREHFRGGKKAGVYLESGTAVCIKRAFKSEEKAIARLEEIHSSGMGTTEKTPVRAYHCGRCQLWHLTSAPLPAGA